MKPWKKVILSFLVGGNFALIAQAILTCLQKTPLTNTFVGNFTGGATLICMGIIGCLLGGFGVYQLLGEWADFGSFLPFSGFAMAIGMRAITPWTQGKKVWDCVRPALWMVIWFNALFAAICIAFGYICQKTGLNSNPIFIAPKNETSMIFPAAFLMGGILTAIFQIVWEIEVKAASGKAQHLHVLMFAWMCGALFAPCGLSGYLANVFGEGFSVMIPVGGLNMYNVGVAFALGETHEGIIHLCSFLLAVCGLAVCCMFTYAIYNLNFGRKSIKLVHAEMANKLYYRKK